jgi:hypothetical protein
MHVLISTINSILTLLSNYLRCDHVTNSTHINHLGCILCSKQISMKLVKIFLIISALSFFYFLHNLQMGPISQSLFPGKPF